MAATYSSTKWPGRAPAGKVLLRGFVGGPHNQEILKRSDEELVQTVLAEFRDILGLNPFAKPLFSRVFRWQLGMPQYTLGHLDRVTLIEDHCARDPRSCARRWQLQGCRRTELHRERGAGSLEDSR